MLTCLLPAVLRLASNATILGLSSFLLKTRYLWLWRCRFLGTIYQVSLNRGMCSGKTWRCKETKKKRQFQKVERIFRKSFTFVLHKFKGRAL